MFSHFRNPALETFSSSDTARVASLPELQSELVAQGDQWQCGFNHCDDDGDDNDDDNGDDDGDDDGDDSGDDDMMLMDMILILILVCEERTFCHEVSSQAGQADEALVDDLMCILKVCKSLII